MRAATTPGRPLDSYSSVSSLVVEINRVGTDRVAVSCGQLLKLVARRMSSTAGGPPADAGRARTVTAAPIIGRRTLQSPFERCPSAVRRTGTDVAISTIFRYAHETPDKTAVVHNDVACSYAQLAGRIEACRRHFARQD